MRGSKAKKFFQFLNQIKEKQSKITKVTVVAVGVYYGSTLDNKRWPPFGYLQRPEKPIHQPAAGMSRVFAVDWNFTFEALQSTNRLLLNKAPLGDE
jgi:hypothetical protein